MEVIGAIGYVAIGYGGIDAVGGIQRVRTIGTHAALARRVLSHPLEAIRGI